VLWLTRPDHSVATLARVIAERGVLVVDDEPSIRLLVRVNLELAGFRVLEAGTLGEARDVLEREPPRLVLLDLHVAGEEGFDLLAEIRQDYEEVPVVLMTGTAQLSSEERRLADATLPKPFTLDQLTSTVGRLARVDSPQ
jgi:DNA-binding NtrC family response regulator